MEDNREEQKEALQVLVEFNVRLVKNMKIVVKELSGKRLDDTDNFLKGIIDAMNWEIQVVNGTLDLLNEGKVRLDKDAFNAQVEKAETEYAKYEDMITDKKNNLELLSSKESELIERTKIAESVYDMFRQSGTDDVREKLIDVMYENQKLREENTTLKELLEKVYEFMKQFVIDGVNLLERFLESVGKVVGKIR